MSETLYPIGYQDEMVTLKELIRRRFSGFCEPEFARRQIAYIVSKGGAMGSGSTGPRPNPSSVSRASQLGRSFHQKQTFSDGTVWFMADDMVVANPGGVHRAPYWSETEDAPRFGIHVFIGRLTETNRDDETWHAQTIEFRGWQSWANDGRKRPTPGFVLPDGSPDIPPTSITQPPTGQTEKIVNELPILKRGDIGENVESMQSLINARLNINLVEDGKFGPGTEHALKDFQISVRIGVDGICGRGETWPELLLVAV